MPPYDDTELFSPERDIAPYAVNFFDQIEGDPTLSRRSKTQLQGTLVGGMQDIELQRLKLQQERDETNLRRQRMAQGSVALESARMQLDREKAAAATKANAETGFRSIMDADADPMDKAEALNRWAFDNPQALADPDVKARFNLAHDIIGKPTKPAYTNEQITGFASEGVPIDVVQRGNPYEIGVYQRAMRETERQREIDRKNAEQASEKRQNRDYAEQHEMARDRQQKKLGVIRLKTDPTGAAVGFKDEDAQTIKLLLDDQATKEERDKFDKASIGDKHKLLLDLQGRAIRGEKRLTPEDKAAAKSRL